MEESDEDSDEEDQGMSMKMFKGQVTESVSMILKQEFKMDVALINLR